MQVVLVNSLGGLSLPRKSVVRLTDYPYMTIAVYCGHWAQVFSAETQKVSFVLFTRSRRV